MSLPFARDAALAGPMALDFPVALVSDATLPARLELRFLAVAIGEFRRILKKFGARNANSLNSPYSVFAFWGFLNARLSEKLTILADRFWFWRVSAGPPVFQPHGLVAVVNQR